jgi:hypothetical protein
MQQPLDGEDALREAWPLRTDGRTNGGEDNEIEGYGTRMDGKNSFLNLFFIW